MARLVGDIRSAFAGEEDITFRSAARLEYLNAVIEESLRLYPPFVTSLARVVPQGGLQIDGHYVPEGVIKPRFLTLIIANVISDCCLVSSLCVLSLLF